MNLAITTDQAQPQTRLEPFLEFAANHIAAASRIADTDLRYLNAKDLQTIRTNLFLAHELLTAVKNCGGQIR